MNSQNLAEYPFPELLHGVSSLKIETPKHSPVTSPSKPTPKQQSPLRAEAPSFIPGENYQSPNRGTKPHQQPTQESQFSYSSQLNPRLHHRSKTEPHPHLRQPSPPKLHPHRHPLPAIPRVTFTRQDICMFFGMEDMIDDLYEDVVQFLEKRPNGRTEAEALDFYLEFVAGGGERHIGERMPCRYCDWFRKQKRECEYLSMGIRGGGGRL
ncbi:hypothetical protein ONS95_013622 [Cadophora gregata]|uniref:uncharacterized protein n=1 Tax=Cadophora gregata TaxID=51156 RepID=UPI0026DD34C4|nr:uncharacterized protein ONS95_013622 [Cadophora gregata]KAK0113368.1 hypothetical protein ONS96_014233 [Cadophora gregata f. sp. sojae]KAK0114121.1 hypothetical protein ONS95_013622 [Cadophora gregata]